LPTVSAALKRGSEIADREKLDITALEYKVSFRQA
jgi:hypothetical protein